MIAQLFQQKILDTKKTAGLVESQLFQELNLKAYYI